MTYFCKLLVTLGLINVSFAETFTNFDREAQQNVQSVLQQTLQEINQDIDPSIHLEVLKHCPEVIPILADWVYEDWSPYDPSLTKKKLIEGFMQRLHDDQIPFTLVAFRDSLPIGIATLKAHGATELADLENGSPWGGSLHVISKERGQGVGKALANAVVTIAKQLGYREILFYLSEDQGVSWCTKHGAEIIETRSFRGHVITILRFTIE